MKTKKTVLISVIAILEIILSLYIILATVTCCMFPPQFLSRVLTHYDSDATDYKIFPERKIEKGNSPYIYKKTDNSLSELPIKYTDGKNQKNKILQSFVNDTKTTSFLIVKDGTLIYEQYANGYGENSVNTSFSMAKSIVSLLIGKAIEEGYILSVKQPISDYIIEFKDKSIGNTTIEQLLLMRSDIEYDEDKFLWFGDDSLTYWHPDLRKLALEHTAMTSKYNGKFHYNNYHPLLLGIILERSTSLSVSEYFEKTFWRNIGAEENASWSLDSEKSAFEKMESGINFRAKDFIKIGSMLLDKGKWEGKTLISESWIHQSVYGEYDSLEYSGTFLEKKNVGYKYMWYYVNNSTDFFAWGKSDQILYISPENNTVILRCGKTDGEVKNWIEVIKNIADTL